jgi:hypothetical protein
VPVLPDATTIKPLLVARGQSQHSCVTGLRGYLAPQGNSTTCWATQDRRAFAGLHACSCRRSILEPQRTVVDPARLYFPRAERQTSPLCACMRMLEGERSVGSDDQDHMAWSWDGTAYIRRASARNLLQQVVVRHDDAAAAKRTASRRASSHTADTGPDTPTAVTPKSRRAASPVPSSPEVSTSPYHSLFTV